MASWPGTLPSAPLLANNSEQFQSLVIRTEMDAGPAKVRKRYTAGVRYYHYENILTASQVSTLDTFYHSTVNGGADQFDYTNPRTGSTVSLRFVTPPVVVKLGGDNYRVTFDFEEIP